MTLLPATTSAATREERTRFLYFALVPRILSPQLGPVGRPDRPSRAYIAQKCPRPLKDATRSPRIVGFCAKISAFVKPALTSPAVARLSTSLARCLTASSAEPSIGRRLQLMSLAPAHLSDGLHRRRCLRRLSLTAAGSSEMRSPTAEEPSVPGRCLTIPTIRAGSTFDFEPNFMTTDLASRSMDSGHPAGQP